jgi:hypothetical protein
LQEQISRLPQHCHPDRSGGTCCGFSNLHASRLLQEQISRLPQNCHPDRSGGTCCGSSNRHDGCCRYKPPGPNKIVISTGAYQISYFAELTTTTYAALRKESRTNFIKATELKRKSGVA